jgi:hypothetical protein
MQSQVDLKCGLADTSLMLNWRDALKFNVELDEATCRLKANGQWLTDDGGITPYGKQYFAEELKMLNTAIAGALDEIAFLKGLMPNERISSHDIDRMREKADRDYATLVEFKADAEHYLARRMSTEDADA